MTKGLSKTRLYSIFSGMKSRCYNLNDQHYKWYGAKGITICDEWLGDNGVQNFIEWALNNGYNETLSIDRIDSNGMYCPENCRWISPSLNSSYANQKNHAISPMSKEQKIKTAIAYSGISQAKLSSKIGMTASNFNQKLKRDTFTDEELNLIAEALGATLEPCSFVFPDGMKI